jgi:hypothetical protein
MADSVRIRQEILDEMLAHARREPRIECCGLLAGRDGVITVIYPATNALSSATAYEIEPRELFELFRYLRISSFRRERTRRIPCAHFRFAPAPCGRSKSPQQVYSRDRKERISTQRAQRK